eukprot:TRINITY_DN566_c0_g1_i1.p1 TRINITY_DN566_c0_g1~~TRINITY_DN566_c0_g1_i1.p1  ORF type:complete len:296 (+),score=47.91 TRINITY_DN566_c0_g1_i1:344-1231(+)
MGRENSAIDCGQCNGDDCFWSIIFVLLGLVGAVISGGLLLKCRHQPKSSIRRWGVVLLLIVFGDCVAIFFVYLTYKDVLFYFFFSYLRNIQFTYVAYVMARHGCNAFKKKELIRRVLQPTFGVAGLVVTLYSISVFISALLRQMEAGNCLDDHWAINGGMSTFFGSIFLAMGLFIWGRLRVVRLVGPSRRRKRRRLFALIIIYFFSTLIPFIYSLLLRISIKERSSCSSYAGFWTVHIYSLMRMVNEVVPMFVFLGIEIHALRRPLKPVPGEEMEDGKQHGLPLMDLDRDEETYP